MAREIRDPKFHKVLGFEGIGPCFYEIVGFRAPRKNEFFLSGAIVSAYRAPTDLITQEYWIARPTRYAMEVKDYKPGDPVRLTPGGIPLPRRPQDAL